jgi:mannose-6-phosphate isomerase-like protein (cupin superfamily)
MSEVKVVEKAWGEERWLSLTDKYCFKRITLKQGHLTSLQYHEFKHETTYIESGTALFYWMDENKVVHSKEVGPGFSVVLKPFEVHRFEALTDLVLFEASTPEVHDVVRLEDSYGRKGTSNP